MLRKALIITLALGPIQNVFAGAIDFRIGGDMAELSYLSQVSSFGYGGADIGFGGLINENDDFVASASILVSGSNAGDVQGLHFGVGAKGYFGMLDGPHDNLDADGGAIAIGAQSRYVFSGNMPMAILGEVYYAPDVTTVSDFDELLEYRIAFELEVTPSARAYVGYRKLEVTVFDDHDYDIDDDAHVGVRFEF
jgi:hypothetical protein